LLNPEFSGHFVGSHTCEVACYLPYDNVSDNLFGLFPKLLKRWGEVVEEIIEARWNNPVL
jgi:hypothetical protein